MTSSAAIIAVFTAITAITAITGFYGQTCPTQGFSRTSGFYASTLVIIALPGLLYILFKRKDWL